MEGSKKMLSEKVKEVVGIMNQAPPGKRVEVEIQEHTSNDVHGKGLRTDGITTTITIYDVEELTPIQEFMPKELNYDQDEAIEFIKDDCRTSILSESAIKRVLDVEEEYMRSKGIIED